MSTHEPEVRPVFRKLALGVSVVCLVLGFIFWFVVTEPEMHFASTLCFVSAYVMAVIASTGRLPKVPTFPVEPNARPIFRKLALGVSVVCMLLGLLFTFGDFGQGRLPALVCYFVGYLMAVVAQTGNWPGRK